MLVWLSPYASINIIKACIQMLKSSGRLKSLWAVDLATNKTKCDLISNVFLIIFASKDIKVVGTHRNCFCNEIPMSTYKILLV